ncbi:7-cyano-7-deazaguanine synthase QueC [Methanocaldococcus fervens]|uniref:7-cyano-7-deazaguanine synthase n=1 Tax=Methanocaldococcus fervens (strain DSM 4213 / JCM 15782 / AG86) TaxID=573064 RepID=C7P633_METFA|nr:7-cyano-7-deazaguanine synthase QueC [Methanocaldococcus fervens]ACV24015.1 exsB protein [Methanocaldococcus fervens AG86]
MKAVTVLSGGLDSTVSTLIAKNLGYEITAITFNYGQKAVKREINASKKICEILDINHIVVDLPFIKQFKKSSLITENEIPSLKIEDLDSEKAHETMKTVWVPARNLIMLSIASGFAEALDAEKVFIGINKEEGLTFPDNTIEFVDALNKALEYGTLNKVKIEAPLYDKTKEEIVKIGREIEKKLGLEVLKYSYSCYKDNGEDFLHCGECESCMRRKRAFLMAGVEDKTRYIK